MPTQTAPDTGMIAGSSDTPTSATTLIEILQTFNIADGAGGGNVACTPPNLVGPPQPGRSFSLQYISVFARVPAGQQVHCMINTNTGGQWFALFHQGTFQGFDIYVCSQFATLVIPPTGASFWVTRSDTKGEGNVSIHFAGSFL